MKCILFSRNLPKPTILLRNLPKPGLSTFLFTLTLSWIDRNVAHSCSDIQIKMAATKETTFKFPNMAASFVKHLNDMRQRGQLCDLTVVVMGMQFPCHRAVLAACSSYFRSVFTSGGEVPNELHLPTLKVETFSKILDFMYTHRLTLNAGNTGDILVAATMLNLENVVDVCSQYLKRSMASMAMAVNSSETTTTASSSTEGGSRHVASLADSQEDGIDYFGSSSSFQPARSVGSSRVESPSANPHSTGSPHRKDSNPQWDAPVMKVEPDQMDPSEDSSTSSTAGGEARSGPMQLQSRFTGVRERAVDTAGDGLQLQIAGVTSWSTDGNVLQRDGSAALSATPTHDQYSPTLQVPGTAKRTDDLGKVYYACPVCDSTFTCTLTGFLVLLFITPRSLARQSVQTTSVRCTTPIRCATVPSPVL
ncbi:zinc finger and BTB domain-containing protein 17-like isoform X2 [Branchiostoma lanceolatum]|uniref:zinc finger and BTB domain-containing protein 17-like isoform X2 n=1 Tax=Branchiostoma lanceolatum TaxID=7740 RepID=UPI0034555B7B